MTANGSSTVFSAAEHTVQDAFRILMDQEFLISCGRAGTKEDRNLPNRTRYALLLHGTEAPKVITAKPFI